VPVVALSAHGTPDYRLRAQAAGCDKFLIKPLNFDQLETTLKHLLPAHRIPRTEEHLA
jgi:DNA-binding response OmpR family regulator